MHDYGSHIARHYAAFRPPLHELILQEALGDLAPFELGIDIGCGTGRSTQALKAHCQQVIGIDPARDMLKQASPMSGIRYQWFDGQSLEGLPQADILTFAGAWMYARSQQMVDQLGYLAHNLVLLYDFEILLEPMLSRLGIEMDRVEPAGYDHAANFSSYQSGQFVHLDQQVVQMKVPLSGSQLAHLILADQGRYQVLSARAKSEDVFPWLMGVISTALKEEITVPANCYWTLYQSRKS